MKKIKQCPSVPRIKDSVYSLLRFISGRVNGWLYAIHPESGGKEEDKMKAIKLLGIVVGFWVVLGMGLGTPFCLAGEAKEAATAAPGQQQKEEYQKKVETQLKELNQELKEWKDKAKKMEEKAKAEIEQQLNALSQKEEEASQKAKDLRSKTGKAWEDLKAGVDSAMEDLGKAFDQVRSRLRSS
jgi:phosphoenolpyruvate-protein kinase (PTS system EI component)